jgi:hypothetical protein
MPCALTAAIGNGKRTLAILAAPTACRGAGRAGQRTLPAPHSKPPGPPSAPFPQPIFVIGVGRSRPHRRAVTWLRAYLSAARRPKGERAGRLFWYHRGVSNQAEIGDPSTGLSLVSTNVGSLRGFIYVGPVALTDLGSFKATRGQSFARGGYGRMNPRHPRRDHVKDEIWSMPSRPCANAGSRFGRSPSKPDGQNLRSIGSCRRARQGLDADATERIGECVR